MFFSLNWLKQLVDFDINAEQLEHLLTMSGLEVEQQLPVALDFTGVVVAQVISVAEHPDANKLHVCEVDCGQGENLQIVCGAPNVEQGIKVPLARVHARLGTLEISQAKLRGIASFGMLCSAKELGISEQSSGLLILPEDAPVGRDLRDYLDLDDRLFEVKLTPNRSDCLSLIGIAREVSALTNQALKLPHSDIVPISHTQQRAVELLSPEACPKYLGRIIDGIRPDAVTPLWMKTRLERSGLHAINALVDIGNYVMLEWGQPVHCFDNAKLQGKLQVRLAYEGESLELLNDSQVSLSPTTLIIADEQGPVAMAGIMGGKASAVSSQTQSVFLEAAFFMPDAIVGRSREYGFSSESSHRFERGVDFNLPERVMARMTSLIIEICGGYAGEITTAEQKSFLPPKREVQLSCQRARQILGVAISDEQMLDFLNKLHLSATINQGVINTQIPSYRFDLKIEEDLIEEVIRLYGYDNLPSAVPNAPLNLLECSEKKRSYWTIRQNLRDRGFQEVINYAFVTEQWEQDFCHNQNPVRIGNPISSDMTVMRSSLIGGLVANMHLNQSRQQSRMRLFEIGRCFLQEDVPESSLVVHGISQPMKLAALITGTLAEEQWGIKARKVDFFDLKSELQTLFSPNDLEFFKLETHPALHPGRAAQVLVNGQLLGIIGELHPIWIQKYDLNSVPVIFEIDLEALQLSTNVPLYEDFSRFPLVTRDLALVVDQTMEAEKLKQELLAAADKIVQDVYLFDVYQGEGLELGKKSMAFRVLLQDKTQTLSEQQIDMAIQKMLKHVCNELNAQLRGN